MAKPNYQFEKRQREQDKKKKKAEKAHRKAQGSDAPAAPLGTETIKEAEAPTP
ncbi:MAG: hypothetical protein RI920_800 [Pseudomonadota bacterium]|jgi:hypothetical protein